MIFKLLLWGSLIFAKPSTPHTDAAGIRLQNDLYIQKNDCGQSNSSQLYSVYFTYFVDKTFYSEPLLIQVNEKNSKFNQTIVYNGKYFFYPSLFGESGHKEYGMPVCDKSKTCYFSFFIFDTDQLVKQKELEFEVRIYQTNPPNKLQLSNPTLKAKGKFDKNYESLLFKDLNLNYTQDFSKVETSIDKKKLKQLINEGYTVELIYSYRKSLDQYEYSEETAFINKEDPWLQSEDPTWPLKSKLKNPTYLSFMVLLTKGSKSYETKIEVLNKNNSFYSCK